MNFMAVERIGNVAWESILADVQAVFNEEQSEADEVGRRDQTTVMVKCMYMFKRIKIFHFK